MTNPTFIIIFGWPLPSFVILFICYFSLSQLLRPFFFHSVGSFSSHLVSLREEMHDKDLGLFLITNFQWPSIA
jgi:hypothetical protein